MTKIEEVAEATYRLETILPRALYTFSAYLIRETEGVLIEPGPASMVPSIQEGMEQLGIQSLSYIIPTHIHLDHGGGAGRLAELFPHARVVLHPRGARHVASPSRLIEGTKMAYGDDFELTYGPILPVPEPQIKVPADGETISINGRELIIVYAPGHALHHIAVYDSKTGGLFCGEALGLPISGDEYAALPSVSEQDFYLDLYLATIQKLERLKPRMLFYSHTGGVREPAELISSLKKSTLVLDDAILAGLKNGESTESIERRVKESLSSQLGVETENMSMETTILGYTTYYRKKGLI
ncbi:MAG: MBL fold metallo-hydrolase [Dehalococcoidales bacterium]|nr:MAG: MBL fold metallo-hydrolase [Dehalococcoidales bacterium]